MATKKYYDRFGNEIKDGTWLFYDFSNGDSNHIYVTEKDDDLGTIDPYTGDFISLSTTLLHLSRVDDDEGEKYVW